MALPGLEGLQGDFEQKLAERSSRLVEATNARDTLQTQLETLERLGPS